MKTEGEGTVTVDPNQEAYKEGTTITVTADSQEGWYFDHWEGYLQGSINESNTIVINSDIAVKAVFKEGAKYEINDSTTLTNNSALLTASGFNFGSETTSISNLRKEVPITLSNPNSNFEVGTENGSAYVVRSSTDSEAVYLIVPVENTSSSNFGFVEVSEITYKDSSGSTLCAEDSGSYINGSVGNFFYDNDITTDTCLFAGEKGYLLEITTEQIYSKVEKIEINSITGDSDSNLVRPQPEIVPQSLVYKRDDFSNKLTIEVENKGTDTGYIAQKIDGEYYSLFHSYILLDSNDVPVDWGFISENVQPENGVVAAGETGLISENYFSNYEGSANKIIAFIDYDTELFNIDTSSVTVNTLSSQETFSSTEIRKLLELRNKKEKEKQQSLK